jgi:hypothetical protein
MATIRVPPEVVDRALAIVVDEDNATVAVWKGRSRVDIYGLDSAWHEVMRPYPLEEEGLWSRDEVVAKTVEALAEHQRPANAAPVRGPMVEIDARVAERAGLVRARRGGYAIWDGAGAVDVFADDGTLIRHVSVPDHDLLGASRLMADLLEGAQPASA